jgi:hypothetical protein
MLEKPAWNKHTSFLRTFVNYGPNFLIPLGTGVVSCLSLRLEWLVEDKRSSLFSVVIGDEESKDLCPCHQGSLLLEVVANCYDGWQVNLKKELFCTPATSHSGKWRVLAKVYYKMDFLFTFYFKK